MYVTCNLGDAMAGLSAFRKGEPGYERLKRSFIHPEAQVALSRVLTERFRVSAMIDLSDGLASDLGHICEESGCGASVNEQALPLSQEFRDLMERECDDPAGFAIPAGEDYGLLFTSPDHELFTVREVLGRPISRIGTITGDVGVMVRVRPDGAAEPISLKGYEHFKRKVTK